MLLFHEEFRDVFQLIHEKLSLFRKDVFGTQRVWGTRCAHFVVILVKTCNSLSNTRGWNYIGWDINGKVPENGLNYRPRNSRRL